MTCFLPFIIGSMKEGLALLWFNLKQYPNGPDYWARLQNYRQIWSWLVILNDYKRSQCFDIHIFQKAHFFALKSGGSTSDNMSLQKLVVKLHAPSSEWRTTLQCYGCLYFSASLMKDCYFKAFTCNLCHKQTTNSYCPFLLLSTGQRYPKLPIKSRVLEEFF